MWKQRIPAYLILPALVVGSAATLALGAAARKRDTAPRMTPEQRTPSADPVGPYRVQRIGGFQLTRPVLYGEPIKASKRYTPLRDSLSAVIERHRAQGRITSAAVFVRDFDQSEWTGVNLSEAYDPGSMLKVTVMMHWLERAMRVPGVLEQRFVFHPVNDPRIPAPRITGPHIEPGGTYTVRELLRYMIVHSDNNATLVLNSNMDADRFVALFEELGLPRPKVDAQRYPMNCHDLSVFLTTLYNSTVLTPEYSEMALKLLSESTFNDGIRKGVPAGVPLVHKFGESGTPAEIQLHEVGIVYAPHPYLISAMTRGSDIEAQKALLTDLSACAYRKLGTSR